MNSGKAGGVSSVVGYIFTFLATLAVLIVLAVAWNHYSNQGIAISLLAHYEFVMANIHYLAAFSLIVVLGELAYKSPRRRRKSEEGQEDEGLPPFRT